MNPWLIVIAGVAALGIAFGSYSFGVSTEANRWKAVQADLDRRAGEILDTSHKLVRAKEAERQTFVDRLEDQHATDQQRIDGLRLANGRLLDATCGLYDKNGRLVPEGGADRVPGDPGAARSAQGRPAFCNLPGAVRDALQRFGRGAGELLHDADAAALYAQTGHAFAVGLPP